MSKDYLLFAYGSLLNPASASRALGRETTFADYVPRSIAGYRRNWRVGEQVFSEVLQRTVVGVFLNIEAGRGGQVAGAELKISAEEMQRLKLREKNYATHNLGQDPENGLERVTFVAQPKYLVTPMQSDTWVLIKYMDLVAEGCRGFGRDFSHAFSMTTERIEFPLLSGVYRFNDAAQASLV